MRAYIPAYDLRIPGSLSEALSLLAQEPGVWKPFAGGTDLMVLLEAGKLSHKRFFSVAKLDDLRGIAVTADFVTLGALTTYAEKPKAPHAPGRNFRRCAPRGAKQAAWPYRIAGRLEEIL